MAAFEMSSTRIFLNKEGQLVISMPNSGYEPTEEDVELKEVGGLDIRMRPNEVVIAEVKLMSLSENPYLKVCRPVFMVADPITGRLRSVKKIEFTDGDIWENQCVVPQGT